jgi:hypothetical protein
VGNERLREITAGLGDLLVEKQRQYGDSVGSTSEILRQLYPDGIRPDQYDDLQILVRTLDKLKRIASRGPDGQDRGGENPWQDTAGYAVLALELAERRERDDVRYARPACPTSCRGCKRVQYVAVDRASYCGKTNRPSVTARVEIDDPMPGWCPGREETE